MPMASFPIHPLSRFEQTQTSIKRPKELLYFSFDEKHHCTPFSTESLRYYYPPYVQAPGTSIPSVDLTLGFPEWIKSDDSVDGHLNALLETVQAHEELRVQEGRPLDDVRIQSDIVTWRGMMTKIMTAMFDVYSEFEMNATCYQGTIYIEEDHASKHADERRGMTKPPRQGEVPQEMMQYWGYKFESVSTLSKPWGESSRAEIESRDQETVNNNVQYCSIVRTGIGDSSLLLAGEVDCVLGEKPENPELPIPWVELKTSAEPPSDSFHERQKFERKMLRFWAQSFLLGVPTVVVGFRTPNGFLSRIAEFETQKIPGIVARGERSWNGNVCISFTAAFLEFLKHELGGKEGVWRIQRKKNSKEIRVYQIAEKGTGEILPAAFKEHRDRLVAAEIASKLGGTSMVE